MKSKLIIGIQPYLDLASQLWSELDPELKLVTLEINQDSNYFFDLSELAKFSPKQFSAFVACDHQFLNFRRLELMSELKKIGFCMPSLLAKSAYIGKDAIIGENCFICPGTVIGPKAKLGFNCFIGSLSSVNQGAVLGNSVWLGTAVHIGMHCKIGSNSTVLYHSAIANNVEIGKQVLIEKPGFYNKSIQDKSFFLQKSNLDVSIIGNGPRVI